MTYVPFVVANKTRVRPLAVAMDKRHPLIPDVPTFKELGVNWVDGAYRGIGVPKSTPPEQRKRLSDLWMALNNDPEMKDLAAKNGFELVNVGLEQMDAFMKERTQLYTEGAVDQAVADHFGVSRQIVYLWRSRDDKFDAACDRGKRAGEELRAAAIREQVSGERPDLRKQPPSDAVDKVTKEELPKRMTDEEAQLLSALLDKVRT
jgi:hypothetical protein